MTHISTSIVAAIQPRSMTHTEKKVLFSSLVPLFVAMLLFIVTAVYTAGIELATDDFNVFPINIAQTGKMQHHTATLLKLLTW